MNELTDTDYTKEQLIAAVEKMKKELYDYEVQFEQSSDGILIIENHKFARCNQAIVDMLGYSSKEQFLNLHPSQLSPQYQPDGKESFVKAEEMMSLALQNNGHRFEWVHRKANGEDFWVEVTLSPQQYADHIAIHVIWKDISALKSMQEQLIEREKMSALGSLVAGVAHEINTPIGAALTGCTHIEDETASIFKKLSANELGKKRLLNYLQLTEKVTASMHNSLINATKLVHSFKQIAVDQHDEQKRAFNLKSYCDETFLSLQHSFISRSISFNNLVDSSIELHSYAGIYSQILTNLFMNSLVHAFDEQTKSGEITLSGTIQNNILQLTYEDNGKGIKEEHLNRIFEPFFTTKLGKGGSGLGLNIIYNLINHKLNGKIICKNKEVGITISITIPLQ